MPQVVGRVLEPDWGRLARDARRLVFQLAEVGVPRALFQGLLERIGRLALAPG
jgi:hypothetical protein